jgi:peptide/nickel transport system substrate-binding protein
MERNITRLSRRDILRATAGTAAFGLGASFLAACGASSGTKGSSSSAGVPKKGGTLSLGMTGASTYDSADVSFASSNWDYMLASLIFDRLNGDFVSGGFTPMLAEEITLDSSATHCTVRLRSGVEFHNGKTISADDLIATIQRIVNPKNPGAVASLLNVDTAALKKVDALTVSFALTSPNAFLPSHLAAIQSGIVPADFDPKNPVGAGPFMFEDFTPGQSATLARFPNYWNTAPYIDVLSVQGYTSSTTLVNALTSGAADAATTFSLTDLPTLRAASGVTVLSHQAGGFFPYVLYSGKGPFADVRARQAMRLAVDRGQLVETLLSEQGRVANDLFSPNDVNFASSIPQRTQDVGQAKSLLKAAGLDGLNLTMATSPFLANAEVVLAQQLAAVGVNIKVENVDATTFYTKHYAQDPLFVSYWLNQPLARINGLCYVPNAHFPETGWLNPQYESLLTQARAATDPSKRGELEVQMQQIYYDQGPWLIWGFENEVDAVASNVHGTTQDTSGFPFGRFLAFKDMWLD